MDGRKVKMTVTLDARAFRQAMAGVLRDLRKLKNEIRRTVRAAKGKKS